MGYCLSSSISACSVRTCGGKAGRTADNGSSGPENRIRRLHPYRLSFIFSLSDRSFNKKATRIYKFLYFLLAIVPAICYTRCRAKEPEMQVSYIGSTSASQAGRVGSTPITCSVHETRLSIPQYRNYPVCGIIHCQNLLSFFHNKALL